MMKSNLILMSAALILSATVSAQATGNNNGNGCRNRCGDTVTNAPTTNKFYNLNKNYNQNVNANVNANQNRNQNRNTNSVRSNNRNSNVAYGGSSTSTATSRSTSRSYNAGNHQSMNYHEAKQRLQAPGIAASFSSTVGSPCEATPFGLGGSGPGFGGLLQVPVQRGECWGERSADRLMAWGCQNAALAVLAGNSVAVAIQNNPCGGGRRAIHAKY